MEKTLLRMLLDIVVMAEGEAIRRRDRAFASAAALAADGVRATETGLLATGRDCLVRATEAYLAASGVRVLHARVLEEIDAELNRSRALVRTAA